ncbi:hypothetical protein EVAR_6947_1 [Eumeta japonica]|uniref:Uncharacterized protein n=1 Tax=Eumeta variegata TaxID=151549 RepID=A0A4C1TGH5_EUMVA|nr:hypothetical protein EVAR_6947_1 [Eumeta japonica]
MHFSQTSLLRLNTSQIKPAFADPSVIPFHVCGQRAPWDWFRSWQRLARGKKKTHTRTGIMTFEDLTSARAAGPEPAETAVRLRRPSAKMFKISYSAQLGRSFDKADHVQYRSRHELRGALPVNLRADPTVAFILVNFVDLAFAVAAVVARSFWWPSRIPTVIAAAVVTPVPEVAHLEQQGTRTPCAGSSSCSPPCAASPAARSGGTTTLSRLQSDRAHVTATSVGLVADAFPVAVRMLHFRYSPRRRHTLAADGRLKVRNVTITNSQHRALYDLKRLAEREAVCNTTGFCRKFVMILG